MSRISKKKKAVVFVATAVALIGGGFAFAYWTTGGSGTGTAATDTSISDVTVNQTSSITGLFPGGPAVPLAGNFDNSNDGSAYVTQVSVAVDPAWSEQSDANKPACTADDFVLVQPAATNADVGVGTGVGSWSGASIKLANLTTNQDNCKNVTVDLVYSSN